jgi:GrpB-like predicted nucleotidyltransferase (UPF0157 family)
MKFFGQEEYLAEVLVAFQLVQARVQEVVPYAEIEHIGSSAIRGSISEGDLDILVRVSVENFNQALEKIQTLDFFIKEGTLRTESLCMLETPRYGLDVAIQLIEKGSEFEDFVVFRDRLNADPALVEEYNDLKRRATGLSPNDYRAIKSEFIVRVLGR